MSEFNEYNFLCHHGILGMKWGIRRYQNPDGSLTSAGKARYSKELYKTVNQIEKSVLKGKDSSPYGIKFENMLRNDKRVKDYVSEHYDEFKEKRHRATEAEKKLDKIRDESAAKVKKMGIDPDSVQGDDLVRKLYRENKNTKRYETEYEVFAKAANTFARDKGQYLVNDLVGKYGDKKAQELYPGGPEKGKLRFWTEAKLNDMFYDTYYKEHGSFK